MARTMLCKESMARVLIIDDDPAIREAVAELLKLDGHEVAGKASNALKALELTRQGCQADVILLDVDMPLMNKSKIVAALEEYICWPPAVVILSSAPCPYRVAAVARLEALRKGDHLRFARPKTAVRSSRKIGALAYRPGRTPAAEAF